MRSSYSSQRPARRAFTLVEILVVVGIIGLLMAIALPAISGARNQAKAAASKATLSVIATGVESFHADALLGGDYPPSVRLQVMRSPYSNQPADVCGANLLVWALAGADLLGTPGFRDLDGNLTDFDYESAFPWIDNTGRNPAGVSTSLHLYSLNPTTSKPIHSRTGPYVDVSKMKFPTKTSENPAIFTFPIDTRPSLSAASFLDSFDQPILYYRANKSATLLVSDQQLSEVVAPKRGGTYAPAGIYNFHDNSLITGCQTHKQVGVNLGAGLQANGIGHFPAPNPLGFPSPKKIVGDPMYVNASFMVQADARGSFEYAVNNPGMATVRRPHNTDSFLLLSAGPDGVFGTADDIGNFPINK